MLTRRIGLAAILVLAGAFGSPAGAVSLYAKFYTGTTGYGGPFSGAGTVYDNTKSLSTNCPTTGSCSSDNVASSLVFSGPGITATANKVWDDLSPNFGGLGVGSGSPSDTDQIAGSDVLNIAFNTSVTLTGVGTLFASAHEDFGPGFSTVSAVASASNIAFLLSVDGGAFNPIDFGLANSMSLALIGTTFAFEQAQGSPSYYVSALSYATCGGPTGCAPPPSTTPLPATLPLFATGLGGLGLFGWRRKRKNKTAAAVA